MLLFSTGSLYHNELVHFLKKKKTQMQLVAAADTDKEGLNNKKLKQARLVLVCTMEE
jgi:hypothetical protein